MALEQNKGRRPHSHSGNKESNHSSSAEVKNASEIKKKKAVLPWRERRGRVVPFFPIRKKA